MPELLMFKWDHSTQSQPTPSIAQLAALPKTTDLITWQVDGWNWGVEELTHPWFRVVSWLDAVAADLDSLLAPQLSALDANQQPTTYELYRGFHIAMVGPSVPLTWLSWWNDDTRAQAKFTIPHGSTLTVVGVKTAYAPVPVAVVTPGT